MRARPLGFWSGIALVVTLGACSNIIGISSIEIDPALDGGSSGKTSEGGSGGISHGGKPATAGDANMPEGGDPTAAGTDAGGKSAGGNDAGGKSAGGNDTGGKSAGGNANAGSSAGGSVGMAGEGGEGGEPPIMTDTCQSAKDCDDTIDCTVDSCGADHKCVHTADNGMCTPGTGACSSTCKVGIGCVDVAPLVKELLLDPNFDDDTSDWAESSNTYNDQCIFADAAAQSAPNSVQVKPAKAGAAKQELADTYQEFHVPKGTTKLTVSGYYKMLPGADAAGRPISADYATLSLWSLEQPPDATHNDTWYIRYIDYHEWDGDGLKQAAWTAFSYETPKATIAKVVDTDITLDLVAETWDTKYFFDSMSLKATYCP